MSWGPVKILVKADPARVRLDRDILLTISITSPSEIALDIPPLQDRVEGFVVSGSFDRDPTTADGNTSMERRVRLTPVLAQTYRLAPMAITYTDKSMSPPRTGWFATRAVTFESIPLVDGDPGKRIASKPEPVRIYPSPLTVLLYVCGVLGVAGLGMLTWKLLHRVRRHIQLMRMSPRERAIEELHVLLAKDLVSRDLVKEFYLELTMIVRRYIERQHGVRAPEQTTEEFLAAVSRDDRFKAEVVSRLRTFLRAADLVKFAAHRPPAADIDRATETAQEYIQTDAAADSEARENDGTPREPEKGAHRVQVR